MLENETKRRIDTARDILVGKVPDPKSQVEQITIALIYKFMDDMDRESVEMGGKASFFTGEYKRYCWSNIFDPRLGGHEMLNLYAEAIVKLNQNAGIPQLFRDIFKNAYLPYRDPETLKLFLRTISEFNYNHSENLGDAFEYLLSVLGSQGDAGQFRTPRNIIDFMVEVIDPQKNEIIVDPACGTAGFLISSYKHIIKANTKKVPGDSLTTSERKKLLENFRGYDISPDMVRLSLVNLYLHGFSQPKIFEYDTLTSDERWNEYADVILANPPFMSPKGGIKPHKRFSVQSSRSEVLFVDYIAEHLNTQGRAAVIVPEGIIFQSGTAYKQLRKLLVEKYLYAVASLPAGVFNPYSGVKTSVLFLDPLLARKSDSILFVKIENDGFSLGAQRRAIEKNDLPEALKIIQEFRKKVNEEVFPQTTRTSTNEKKEEKKLSQRRRGAEIAEGKKKKLEMRNEELGIKSSVVSNLIVTKEKIAANGEYNLSGERYREGETRGRYSWYKIGELVHTITPPHKIQKISFNLHGRYPIIDQSHDSIAGWTDDETAIIHPNTPLVIFGDHTCIAKLVDFPFAQGADGIKILQTAICLDPKYLFYILRARPLKITGYQRHFSLLREYKVPLPPLEIQKEIVAEIEGYQKIIDGARQVVENWKPHIEIDPDWPMVELGEVCKPEYGYTESASNSGDARFIRITDIAPDGTLKSDDAKFIKLNSQARGSILSKGDILIARTGATFGKTMIFEEDYPAVFASFLIRLRFPKKYILPRFYWIFAQSDLYWNQANSLVTGGGQPQFNGNVIINIKIPFPPIERQRSIIEDMIAEQNLVSSNRELITRMEKKIQALLGRLWGEDSSKVDE